MSTEERKIVKYEEDRDFFDAVDLVQRMTDYKKAKEKAEAAESARKEAAGELQKIIDAYGCDTVQYGEWSASIVRGTPGEKLNLDLLRTNLMKVGKLDAELIQCIFEASMEPTDPKETYAQCRFGADDVKRRKREKRTAFANKAGN